MKVNAEQMVTDVGATEEIVRFLRSHPDFLCEHPELVEKMHVPHRCGAAVSLVEHQVSVLRDHNHRLRREFQSLIERARENEALYARLHSLTLALLACETAAEVFDKVSAGLMEDFGADFVVIQLFVPPPAKPGMNLPQFVGADGAGAALFKAISDSGDTVCGHLRPEQWDYLFSAQWEESGSAALQPLGDDTMPGLLAIGSRDPEHFHPAMGNAFLQQLGGVLTAVLARWI